MVFLVLEAFGLFRDGLIVSTLQFSKHRPSGPMLSISVNVRLRVCVFTFEVPFKHLFAPTSRSWMSNIFRDLESLGEKVMERSDLYILFESGLKLPGYFFFFLVILPYKTLWKPHFPVD